MGSTLVPAAVAGFVASHPKVSVTLQVHPSLTVRDLVAVGGFDVGLAADEIDVSGVEHQVFATPRMLCAVPAGHHLAERSVIRSIDLHEESFVVLAPEDTVRRAMNADLKAVGSRPRIVVETPYSLTVAALVGRGIGIGLVNPYSLGDIDRGKITLRGFEPALHARTLLLLPPGQQKSGLVRSFIDALITARNKWHLN
jgi:DNA-binding transcriptional LysR family regulator